MKADFSGYATKAGIRCSDGRTIMPGAFKHQDKMQVPLVWQHGHSDPEYVLGHCILENREDGVYAYGYFNDTAKAIHAKSLVKHKDINALSIWANQLVEKAGRVIHGAIKEVSLVLAGANPGALIEHINIRHGDDVETLEDEAIIHSGVELDEQQTESTVESNKNASVEKNISHADDEDDEDGETAQDVYDSLTDKQKTLLHFMVGEAAEKAEETAEHSATNTEGNSMGNHNVFESQNGGAERKNNVLSHSELNGLLETAKKKGRSVKETFEEYALQHGIDDIETLFPDAKTVGDTPEWVSRRMEWVDAFLGAVRKTPFSRIRTVSADITMEQARAKGYIKGNLKKEEFFPVLKRVTTPTTIYKKQALDRDDVIDITDFDVVVWLRAEMRVMLDEEIARAALLGDGRDVSDEDKINEQNIRPIASDNELYTTTVNVNVSDANSSMLEVADAFISNRFRYKGTGTPTMFTTEYWIARFLVTRDGDNKRMWKNLDELATELRVRTIVPVEVMTEYPDIIAVLVNPIDYVMGADRGGQVATFEDFDIDYNKHKYLIETRLSGALVKVKSAMVFRSMPGASTQAIPVEPTFDPATGALTITNTTGVVYKHGSTTVNAAGSPYTVPAGTTWVIDATPATGYYFPTSDDDSWSFTADA